MRTYSIPRFDKGDVFYWFGGVAYTVCGIDYQNHRYLYTSLNSLEACDIDYIDKYAK